MLNKILEISFENPLDKLPHENEDAIRVHCESISQIRQILISDGAGGVGIFCKEWANFIVNNPPSCFPEEVDLDEWMIQTSKDFFSCQSEIQFSDNPTKEKFFASGSYATYLILWLDYNKFTIHYSGIGDTCLFVFRKFEKDYLPILIYPLNKNEFIDQNPTLVNWKKVNSSDQIHSLNLLKDDIIIAGTDAVSRWLLNYLFILSQEKTRELLNPAFRINNEELEELKFSGPNFKSLSNLLDSIPKDEEQAIAYFSELMKNKSIEADDITLYIEKII